MEVEAAIIFYINNQTISKNLSEFLLGYHLTSTVKNNKGHINREIYIAILREVITWPFEWTTLFQNSLMGNFY